MASSKSSLFAPLPICAIADRRLTRSHWAVLAAVCYHDRLSASRQTGQGCWASNKTLAVEANVHYHNVSGLLADLVAWGYLTQETLPLNRKVHVYRVIYRQSKFAEVSPIDERPWSKLRAKNNRIQQVQTDRAGKYIPQKRRKIDLAEFSNTQRGSEGISDRDEINIAAIRNALEQGGRLDNDSRAVLLEMLPRYSTGTERFRELSSLLNP